MTVVSVDSSTGALLRDGKPLFPLGLSDAPPVDGVTPTGSSAWAEIAGAGVSFARSYPLWTAQAAGEQLIAVGQQLDAAVAHGLQLWLGLAGVAKDLSHEALLEQIVTAVKAHPGLGAWKGADEPAHGHVSPASCAAVFTRLHTLDPAHPVVLIEAPRGPSPAAGKPDTPLTAAAIRPYAAACDIHGVDIYPVSVPPGAHAGGPPINTDISVVGDMTRLLAQATPQKALWTTLQIAWSGVLPPAHKLVFPTLQQARFMAYDAIIAGARGLFFFGGHLKQAMSPADQRLGWNWTYWEHVQRSVIVELADADHQAAFTAPVSTLPIRCSLADVALSARSAGGYLYLVTARRSPTASGVAHFTGLPSGATSGVVLAHPGNPARHLTAASGQFSDPSPYGPHNARVYRFLLPSTGPAQVASAV